MTTSPVTTAITEAAPVTPLVLGPRELHRDPKIAALRSHLTAHFMHLTLEGRFPTEGPRELPQMRTSDGITLVCDPDLGIGLTLGGTAFGLEVADMRADQLCLLAQHILRDLEINKADQSFGPPLMDDSRRPLGTRQLELAHGEQNLMLSCVTCRVDPSFNGQHRQGARLIVQLRQG